jgi:hypothetical protein
MDDLFPDYPAWATRDRRRYLLDIARQTPTLNEIREMHFHAYKKLRREWRALVLDAIKDQRVPALTRCGLVLTRRTSSTADWDGFLGGAKPMLDCLVLATDKNPDGLGLIVDDSPRFLIHAPHLVQQKAKPKAGSITVEIFDLS